MSKIEFIPFKRSTSSQIYRERVVDWVELGALLLRKFRLHREEYRKKICASCSEEQKVKRKCVENTLLDGRKIVTCGHMRSTTGKKFKKEINKHMSFHPAMSRVNTK